MVPRPADPGARPLRRRRTSSPGPRSQEAAYRIFLAQQRVARPALRRARAARQAAGREAAGRPGARGAGRRPRPADRRHPAALPGGRRPGPRACASATSTRPSSGVAGGAGGAGRRCGRELERLAGARGDSDDAMRRVEALVASPQPLIRLLAERVGRPSRPSRARCSRCSPVATTRAATCSTSGRSLVVGRAAVTADYDLQRHAGCTCWPAMGPMSALPAALDDGGAAVGRRSRTPRAAVRRPLRRLAGEPARRRRRDDRAAAGAARRAGGRLPAMRRITVTVCTLRRRTCETAHLPAPAGGRLRRGPR